LEDNPEVKGIVSISEGNADPEISAFWIFQTDCVASRTIDSFDNGFLVVCWDLRFSKKFAVLIDECNFDDPILLGNFNSTLPDHLLPIVKVVAFRGG
jgi:hypothetical protein